MSVVFVWSVVVDIMGLSFPWFLSFRVDWLIELGGIGTGVSSCIDSGVGGDIGSRVHLCVILVGSVVVDIMSLSFPWLLSFRVDWFIVLSGVCTGVGSRIGRNICLCKSRIGSNICGLVDLRIILVWSIVVNVVSASFPWFLSL